MFYLFIINKELLYIKIQYVGTWLLKWPIFSYVILYTQGSHSVLITWITISLQVRTTWAWASFISPHVCDMIHSFTGTCKFFYTDFSLMRCSRWTCSWMKKLHMERVMSMDPVSLLSQKPELKQKQSEGWSEASSILVSQLVKKGKAGFYPWLPGDRQVF